MIEASIFTSVEFYVISIFVAAAVVAVFARPHQRGAARQFLLAGALEMRPNAATEPTISIEALDDGSVRLTRTGLEGLTESSAVSLAVEVVGFDIEIKERISGARQPAWPINTAIFTLDFLGAERYHLHYTNPDLNLMAATPLRNRPGIKIVKRLQ